MRIFTAAEKLKAVERELNFRRRVYARRVEAESMTRTEADYQIAIFEAIAQDYRERAERERLL